MKRIKSNTDRIMNYPDFIGVAESGIKQNHYSLFKILNSGFTLVELMVVITIFGLVILAANQVLFSTFRGSSKSEITGKVKAEGERVISVMERSLHSARSVATCTSAQITYKDQNGFDSSFACVNAGSGDGKVSSGSATLTSDDIEVSSCSFSCETVAGKIKAVSVSLSFSQKTTVLSPRVEEMGSATQKARILLRN